MVVMIDNYDSFTYNIVQYCLELGADLRVVRNDEMRVEAIRALKPEKVIISPGPATPNEAGVSLELVEKMHRELPILGICLGHQAIGQAFGGKVLGASRLMHGKTSIIRIQKPDPIFAGLPESFRATRYHSLVVAKEHLPPCLKVTGWSEDDHEIMALEHTQYPVYGVQFHPESIMSEYGHEILENFLKL